MNTAAALRDEALLDGVTTTEPAVAAFVDAVRDLGRDSPPRPGAELAVMFEQGLTPVQCAAPTVASRPRRRRGQVRRWSARLAVLSTPLTLKIGFTAAAMAATGGLAAAGALPPPLQRLTSEAAALFNVDIPGRDRDPVWHGDAADARWVVPLDSAADRPDVSVPDGGRDHLQAPDHSPQDGSQRAEGSQPREDGGGDSSGAPPAGTARDEQRQQDRADDEARDRADDDADDARDRADDDADDARDRADDDADDARDRADDAADETQDRAEDAEDARDDAEDEVDDARDDAEDEVDDARDDADGEEDEARDRAHEDAAEAEDDADEAEDDADEAEDDAAEAQDRADAHADDEDDADRE